MLIDTDIRFVAEAALSSGERLLWVGRPNPLRLARLNFTQPLFGLVWIGMILFMFSRFTAFNSGFSLGRSSSSGFAGMFQLILFVFMLVGLGMILSPAWHYVRGRLTVYALTDRRALIIQRLPGLSVRSYPISAMPAIERRGGPAEGDLIFGRETRTTTSSNRYGGRRQRTYTVPIGFMGIADPGQVEGLLLDLSQGRGSVQNAWQES